jgi:hypothetical protein
MERKIERAHLCSDVHEDEKARRSAAELLGAHARILAEEI